MCGLEVIEVVMKTDDAAQRPDTQRVATRDTARRHDASTKDPRLQNDDNSVTRMATLTRPIPVTVDG